MSLDTAFSRAYRPGVRPGNLPIPIPRHPLRRSIIPWLVAASLLCGLALHGCSRAPAPAASGGGNHEGAAGSALRLGPAPGSRLEAKDLPEVNAVAEVLRRVLAPAGLRLRSLTAEAAPEVSPFGGGGGGSMTLAIRGQLEAETVETLFRAGVVGEAELRAHGLLPAEGVPHFVEYISGNSTHVGEVRYDPAREGSPFERTVLLRPVAPAGQRVALLFELSAERFGPGRHEFGSLALRPDPAGQGPGGPALQLNLRGTTYGERGQDLAGAGEGVDLPRGRIVNGALLRGSEQEAALWAAELKLKADTERRAAEELVLLGRALGSGATYRGTWQRGRAGTVPASPMAMEFTVERFDANTGAMRARLRRVDPGPPGSLELVMDGEVSLTAFGSGARKIIAARQAAQAAGRPVRLFELSGLLRGPQQSIAHRQAASSAWGSPLASDFPILEFTVLDRLAGENPAGPPGPAAGAPPPARFAPALPGGEPHL